MKKILFCLLIAVPLGTIGQIYNADSLRKLHAAAKINSTKIDALKKLSNYYSNFSPDSEIYYANLLMAEAKRVRDRNAEAYAMGNIGEAFSSKENTVQALVVTLKALQIFEETKNDKYIADTYNSLGNIYFNRDLKTALSYYKKCLLFSIRTNNYDDQFYSQGNLCVLFDNTDKPDSAVYYAKRAIYVHDSRYINYSTAFFLGAMSSAYYKLHDYSMAGTILRDGINGAVKSGDRRVYQLQLNYAEYFIKRNKLDSALVYANKVLNNTIISSEPAVANELYNTLAQIYAVKKQYEMAYQYQTKSIKTGQVIFNAAKVQQLANLTFNERQHKIDLKNAQAFYQNRLRLYILLVALALVIGILLILWRNNRKQQEANRLLESQKQQINNTLQELRTTQKQLIQSEKMASLGELTAGIAHEIQNPLNFVNNFSEVNIELVSELKDGPIQQLPLAVKADAEEIIDSISENLQKVSHHGKRADSIVKSMLEHSRKSTGEKLSTDMNVLCDEFLKLAYHGMRAKDKSFNSEMVTHYDANLPKVNVSQQDVGRVMLNLFNNAFYAVHQKAKTAGPDYKPTVELTTSLAGEQMFIGVKDNGSGIPENIKHKIMQPFFTTKPTGEGTGLGLSLSYDIVVKGHGGKIELSTEEDEFTGFIITLPLS